MNNLGKGEKYLVWFFTLLIGMGVGYYLNGLVV